tara:strand:- start:28 stop:255 length:228 start_codon:yes stop_codon:yes gene_type:complete
MRTIGKFAIIKESTEYKERLKYSLEAMKVIFGKFKFPLSDNLNDIGNVMIRDKQRAKMTICENEFVIFSITNKKG